MLIDILDKKEIENIRFEVIDGTGRQYVKYNVNVVFSVQDDSRTLKIFVNNNVKEIKDGNV